MNLLKILGPIAGAIVVVGFAYLMGVKAGVNSERVRWQKASNEQLQLVNRTLTERSNALAAAEIAVSELRTQYVEAQQALQDKSNELREALNREPTIIIDERECVILDIAADWRLHNCTFDSTYCNQLSVTQ